MPGRDRAGPADVTPLRADRSPARPPGRGVRAGADGRAGTGVRPGAGARPGAAGRGGSGGRHRAPRPTRAPHASPTGALTLAALYGAAGALTLAAVGWTQWHGLRSPGAALAFGFLIAVGEALRRGDRDRTAAPAPGAGPAPADGADPVARDPAPLAAAGALGYVLLERLQGVALAAGGPQAVAVVAAAGLAGAVPRLVRAGVRPDDHFAVLDQLVRRVLTAAFAVGCAQSLDPDRTAVAPRPEHGAYHVGCLLALTGLTVLFDAVLAAALAHGRTGRRYGRLLGDEVRTLPGAGAAVCAAGVVTALAVSVAGLWALPLVSGPLLMSQYSYRRYARARAVHRQTVASLARATEIAGYTPYGHARQVAEVSGAVGRELGLTARELAVLDQAALLHDVGQLSLVDPVPAGATEPLPEAERRRIARLGGAVVRRTGAPVQVAAAVERQAEPYREAPPASRIVRVANAFSELTGVAGPGPRGVRYALERLRGATARELDPEVVAALARVVGRGAAVPVPRPGRPAFAAGASRRCPDPAGTRGVPAAAGRGPEGQSAPGAAGPGRPAGEPMGKERAPEPAWLDAT
ncbi:HD-GYP domain-containing protein [Streptomyces pactum]|uniref:HD-GYP domain-containing protein n=1 Tax=Streptomyces pactum TaxID=68249 RepID=UPI0036FE834E